MKFLVAVKRVVDPDVRIKLKSDRSGIDTESAEYKINPFCENAIEEALRLRDLHSGEVVVVTIGPEEVTSTVRAALALGADRAIRVDYDDARLDSDLAARILATVWGEEEADVFLFGKQAVDGDNNQVGQLVAEYMERPQACFASEIKLDGGEAVVTREVDGGLETIACKLPMVLTADLRLNEPRFPSLPGIMKAKRKPLDVKSLDDLEIDAEDRALKIEVLSLEEPVKRQAGQMVADVDDLLDKLKNEARVLG